MTGTPGPFLHANSRKGLRRKTVSTQLTGSAARILNDTGMYLSASTQLRQDLPDLYVVVLTRNNPSCDIALCNPSEPYVNVVPTTAPPAGIPLGDVLSFTERGYLLPGTANPQLPPSSLTGASAAYLLSPNIICDQSVNTCKASN
jgi:hypothetical protein